MKKLILAAALLLPLSGWAKGDSGFHVGLGIFTANEKFTSDSLEVEDSATNTDVKLGYLLGNGLYFGAAYHMSTVGGTSTSSRTAYGVALGYHRGGWYFDVNYYLSTAINDFIASGANLTGDSGFGADVGYNFFVNNSFYVGMGISYKSLSFKTMEQSGTTVDFSATMTEMHPAINLGFYF